MRERTTVKQNPMTTRGEQPCWTFSDAITPRSGRKLTKSATIVRALLCCSCLFFVGLSSYNGGIVWINHTSTDNKKNDTSTRTWDYHLNMSQLLEEAQIPPTHAPWHVLPPALLHGSNSSSAAGNRNIMISSRHHYNMLLDMRHHMENYGLSPAFEVIHQRLYIVRDGTLFKFSDQVVQETHDGRWGNFGEMFQHALDLGTHLLNLENKRGRRRQRRRKEASVGLRKSSITSSDSIEMPAVDNYEGDDDDDHDFRTRRRIGAETISDHHLELLRWLLGDGNNSNETSRSIPIFASKEDFKGCRDYFVDDKTGTNTSSATNKNYHLPWFTYAMESATSDRLKNNMEGDLASSSVPISSSSAYSSRDKNYCTPFAIPCYEMWQHLSGGLKYKPSDWYLGNRPDYPGYQKGINDANRMKWDLHFDAIRYNFPWDDKKSQVVWRGSSTGGHAGQVESWTQVPRFQMVNVSRFDEDYRATMDVAFSQFVQGWEKEPYKSDILSRLPPGSFKGAMKFTDFLKYKAILDINGNSWSSRFGHLLCLNSVVLKVELDEYVSYFESPGGTGGSPELIPWEHYVPVNKNLSNLIEMSNYVLDTRNEAKIKRIIANANGWCQRKMTVTQFAVDVLWTILNYVDLLYFDGVHDPPPPPPAALSSDGEDDKNDMYRYYYHPDNDSASNYRHPLNFEWMERFVFRSHTWEPVIGKMKTPFGTQTVKVYHGSTYEY